MLWRMTSRIWPRYDGTLQTFNCRRGVGETTVGRLWHGLLVGIRPHNNHDRPAGHGMSRHSSGHRLTGEIQTGTRAPDCSQRYQAVRHNDLLQDLDQLREEILSMLSLPEQKQPVVVYLFADEQRYSQYIRTRYPMLPPRRAYFVGSVNELAVYTYWGDRIQEDLRHEFTHGVLHATLKDVPLWLDEGLAEYFEVTTQPSGMNREYAMNLAAEISSGWTPNLDRLEGLESVDQMRKSDYQESWAWVHFMLNHNDDTRMVLTNYLHELRATSQPGLLSTRLRTAVPVADSRFLSHAAGLTEGVVRVGRVDPK